MSDQPIIIPGDPREVSLPRPSPRQPRATYVIVALNLIVFFLMERAGGSTDPDVLLEFGAAYQSYFRHGEYWRLVMPMFLHIGWLHLLLNTFGLYLLGRILERVYDYGRFALLYVGSGIGSSYLSMRLSDNVSAGASGAIFGIAGVMLVTGYVRGNVVPRRWRRAFGGGILPLIVLNLFLGFTVPHIDNWGHIGGLVTGILLALLVPPPVSDEAVPGTVEKEEPGRLIVVVPILVVALAMWVTAKHYKFTRVEARLLQEGARLRTAQQPDQAINRFREAARLVPGDERPHLELGSIYLGQNRVPEAIQEYQEALQLNPGSPRAQLGLAVAYGRGGDPAKAQRLFEAVLGKNPATPEGHQILADLCAEQKLYAEAIKHFEEALRLKPNMAVAHNNLAWLLATSEDVHYRDPQRALEHARRAVELTRWKEATFIDTLAEAFFANRNFTDAVKVQTRTLELDPRNREYQEHMARYRKAAGA